ETTALQLFSGLPILRNVGKSVSIRNSQTCEIIAHTDGTSSTSNPMARVGRSVLNGGMQGAVAGSIQVFALMWLRTIVNYQYRYGVTTREAIAALYKEGGILRFYRGLSFAIIQNPLAKFGAIAAHE